MKILCLWVNEYLSGSTSERFTEPLKRIGHSVEIVPLETGKAEGEAMSMVRSGKVDLVFHLPYKVSFRPEIMQKISSLGITTIAWNGDDEWMWKDSPEDHKRIIKAHKYCVTTHKDALKNYDEIGFKNVFLESWGFDPGVWNKKNVKKEIPVFFCGSANPTRNQMIKDIQREGIQVVCCGPGYSKKLPLSDMVNCYRKAKIALNFVKGERGGFFYEQVKARNFEIPAVGTFQLSESCQELNRFFGPMDLETFKTPKEAAQKIRYFLENEEEREKIAQKGYEKAKSFSYDSIFRRVLKEIK